MPNIQPGGKGNCGRKEGKAISCLRGPWWWGSTRWEGDNSLQEPGGVVTPPRRPASVGVALLRHQSGRGRGQGGNVPAPRRSHVALQHPQPHLQDPELQPQLLPAWIRAVPVAAAAASSLRTSLHTGEASGGRGGSCSATHLPLPDSSFYHPCPAPRVLGCAFLPLFLIFSSFCPLGNPVVQPPPQYPFLLALTPRPQLL